MEIETEPHSLLLPMGYDKWWVTKSEQRYLRECVDLDC